MANRYCSHCGASVPPGARFCVECGEPWASAPSPPQRFAIDRYAPALIVAAIVLVGGAVVWTGARSAKAPAFIPPRGAGSGGATLPEGHPPIALPDDVRQTIQRMAEQARGKPHDLEAWKHLGLVQYQAGQVERQYLADAAATYEHVLARQPDDPDALRVLGNIAFDREQSARAIEYYLRYLAVRPDDQFVRTDLGTMYLSTREIAKALDAYATVLAADPKFFQAQFNVAIAHRTAGDEVKAVEALQKARDIAPDETTRKRVDELLARLTAQPPPADGGAPAGGFKDGIESIFRSHPILGSRLERIDWLDERTAKVVLGEFPMDGMPPDVRERFIERIKTEIKDQKVQHRVQGTVQVDLIDSGTGRVMATITE